jgi:hypothetical protein
VVAARQAVVDAVLAAKLDASEPALARALAAIDGAAMRRDP